MTDPVVVRSIRTSAIVARSDVTRHVRRDHRGWTVRDPYTGDIVRPIDPPPVPR